MTRDARTDAPDPAMGPAESEMERLFDSAKDAGEGGRLARLRRRLDALEAGGRAGGARGYSRRDAGLSGRRQDRAALADLDASVPDADQFEIVLPEDLAAASALDGASSRRAMLFGPMAAGGLAAAALLASVSVFSDGSGGAGGPEDGLRLAEAGPNAPAAASFRPPSDPAGQGVGYSDIATASIPWPDVFVGPGATLTAARGYLDAAALRQLLRERPVKCVVAAPLPDPDGAGPVSLEALRLAASVGGDCVETIAYEPSASWMVRNAPAPLGGRIEINAAFSQQGDAICHHTKGLSAFVIGGGMAQARARSLETLLEAGYASLGGRPICHRLQALGDGPDGPVFRADAFVDGRLAPERTDPRPFVMKRREEADDRSTRDRQDARFRVARPVW